MRSFNSFSTRPPRTSSTWRLRSIWILLAIGSATAGGWRAALARPAGSSHAPAGRNIGPFDAITPAGRATHSAASSCELFVSIVEAPSRIDTTATGYPPAAVRIRYGYRSPEGSSPDGACLLVSGETSPLRVSVGRTDHGASFQSQPVVGSGAPQWEATGSIQFSVAGTYTLRAEVDGEDALGYRTVSASRSIVVSNQLPYSLRAATQSVPSFAEPGSQHTVTFRVTNTGYNTATIELTCQALTGGNCFSVDPMIMALAAGASGDVTAQVLLPRSVHEATYEMTGIIQPPTNVGYTPQAYARATIATRPEAVTSIAYTGGERMERSLCPIVGAAPGSAVQCGDLVYAHSFPAYRSRNKPRALTLLYNSATADARPVVVVDHATSQGEEATRFVVDVWRIAPGGEQHHIAGVHFDNAAASSSAHRIRRMVVPIAADALGLGTGAYPIRVQVTRFWSTGSEASLPVTGTLLVVNRKRSAWGAGWWPAGVERLHPNQANGEHVLLEDADGSATLFRWDGSRFVAPPGEYSTLVRGGPGFIRTLPGRRVELHYDGAGLMVQVRQLEQQVVSANYHWDRSAPANAPRLQSIVDAAGIVTSFGYGNGQVSTITLPHASAVTLQQVATGTSGVFLLEGIVDPDGHLTSFTYDGSTARMRTSDARATNAFTYEYDAVGRVARALTPLSTADPLTTRHYTSWQGSGAPVAGRAGSSSSDLAPAALRDTVAFHTWQRVPRRTASPGESRAIFFPHVTGAPTLVHAEGGNTTHFERDSAGQATLVRTRSGAYVEQQWDTRGRLVQTRQKVVGGWLSPEAVRWDTTTYEYTDPRWDGPTRIVPPRQAERVIIGYDDHGRRHTVTDGRDATTTLWYAPDGMLDSVRSPLDHPVVYGYDGTTRNLRTVTQGPSGEQRTTTYSYAPNGLELESTSDGTSTTRVQLDAVKRVRRTETGAQFMVYEYDDAARTVRQIDAANRATTWTYDELGRPLTECRVSGCLRTGYQGAVVTSTSRDGGGSHALDYDMYGRVVERVSDWQGRTEKVLTGHDEFGNVTKVMNHTYAAQIDSTPHAKTMWRTPSKIDRKFDAYGRLICEQQLLQALRDTTRFHGVSGWYVYDRMGRRERNIYGGGIGCDVTQYYPTEELEGAQPYSPATWDRTAPPRLPTHGLLNTKDAVSYSYDLAGNLRELVHRPFARDNPAGGTWTWTHDDAGRVKDIVTSFSTNPWSSRGYNAFGDLTSYTAAWWTTFAYWQHDAAGRAGLKEGGGRRTRYEFDASRRLKLEHDQLAAVAESLQYDAAGNIKRRGRHVYAYGGDDVPAAPEDLGRLLQMTDVVMDQQTLYRYDRVGNEIKSGSPDFVSGNGFPGRTGDREQQYTPRSQLRWSRTAVNHHNPLSDRCKNQQHAVLGIEERQYEYDGLGRRVLEVSPHGCAHDYGVSRYFWLDDQVVVKTVNFLLDVAPVASYPDTAFTQVADVRHPVEHGETGTPVLLGQWFVYGPGIDNVLGVRNGPGGVPSVGSQLIRARTHLYMVQDERGSVVRSVCRHFNSTSECSGPSNGGYTAFGVSKDADAASAATSMPGYNGHQATAGLVYMRNRWYDPNTGRFTQEDPIGFAGGSNLYAYAGNDPVNYADPFGLKPCPPDNDCDEFDGSDAAAVLQRLGRMAPAMDKAIKIGAAVTLAPVAIIAGADAAAGGAALTTLNLASRAGAAGGAIPVARTALEKLNGLADKFGTTAGSIAQQALSNGQRMVDNANSGNVNAIIPRLDGASGFIRVTLDPTQSKIISAGYQSANMVSNGLASGRFTPIP